MMKLIRSIVLALAVLASSAARAQIEVYLRVPHRQYLLGEPITTEVEVRNQTGAPLIFDGTNRNARFAFDIESDADTLRSAKAAPKANTTIIPAGQTALRRVELQSACDLRNPGLYKVRAGVEWGENNYYSARSHVTLIPGPEVAQQVFSRPGTDAPVKCSLRVLSRNDYDLREQRLFFCVENKVTGARESVADLGTLLRSYDPLMQRDAAGRMHILHNSAPNRFTHSLVSAGGQLLSQEHFASDLQTPQMINQEGTITVRGRAWRDGETRRATELLRP
ncbi:MAG: hypothetical protein NTV49_02485 [Kiritimatiellaeota bacterium]|nr:hypothetical protein [Kiritimatiellota bacterium]